MITLATFSNDDVLPFIGSGKPPRVYPTNEGPLSVNMRGARLECLKRNQTCIWCRNTGDIWCLQRHENGGRRFGEDRHIKINCFLKDCPWCDLHPQPNRSSKTPHFNLYFRDKANRLILMTQDHRIPRSKGGSNGIDNLDTMCFTCNNAKGSLMPKEFLEKMRCAHNQNYGSR